MRVVNCALAQGAVHKRLQMWVSNCATGTSGQAQGEGGEGWDDTLLHDGPQHAGAPQPQTQAWEVCDHQCRTWAGLRASDEGGGRDSKPKCCRVGSGMLWCVPSWLGSASAMA